MLGIPAGYLPWNGGQAGTGRIRLISGLQRQRRRTQLDFRKPCPCPITRSENSRRCFTRNGVLPGPAGDPGAEHFGPVKDAVVNDPSK